MPLGDTCQMSLSEVENLEDEIEVDEEAEFMVISDQNDMGQVRVLYFRFIHGASFLSPMMTFPDLSKHVSGLDAAGLWWMPGSCWSPYSMTVAVCRGG